MGTGTLILILLVFAIGIVAAVGILLHQSTKKQAGDQSFVMLQNQIAELNKVLDAKMLQSNDMFQRQFSETHKIVADVTEKLTKLDETNNKVVGFAGQLQSLQDILKNPKQRGVLGEYYLETLLKNVLPPNSWEMQHKFNDGTIVDAIVRVKDKIIPIDSKFSLENYNRIMDEKNLAAREHLETDFRNDLKKRIDETAKYVKPEEGTMEFAFMFIPHEAIYYDLLINRIGGKDLIEYAFKDKHVLIVSPTSFFAYLQTVLQGLKALQIEETAKEIRKRVEQLGKHLTSYESHMKKLGTNLTTTVKTYNESYKELGKIDKDVLRITDSDGERSILPLTVDVPQMAD